MLRQLLCEIRQGKLDKLAIKIGDCLKSDRALGDAYLDRKTNRLGKILEGESTARGLKVFDPRPLG